MSVIALFNLHFISKQNVSRKKLNLYTMHVFELYTALFMHVLTISLQDLCIPQNIKISNHIIVYVYVVDQLTVLDSVGVCVLNGNRNNVLIAIF